MQKLRDDLMIILKEHAAIEGRGGEAKEKDGPHSQPGRDGGRARGKGVLMKGRGESFP